MITEWTEVPTDAGALRALLHAPDDADGPLPGIVLVDGSGDGACDDWGEWPERFVDQGAVVLTHDKPGCGGSPGDWTTQSFADRAKESLSALDVLRTHPGTRGQPVGLLGISQGGWVALLAAALEPTAVDLVISVSGPGVTPSEQERWRIARALADLDEHDRDEALAWLAERDRRLLAGDDPAAVLADQERFADRAWYDGTTAYMDSAEILGFIARILDFDPAEVLPQVRCPVLALFGGNDSLVPIPESVIAYATHLPSLPGAPHGLAVFPGADHGLFTADPDPDVPRTEQLAPGYLPMVRRFLADARDRAPANAPS
jgi:uncharacterized protein